MLLFITDCKFDKKKINLFSEPVFVLKTIKVWGSDNSYCPPFFLASLE